MLGAHTHPASAISTSTLSVLQWDYQWDLEVVTMTRTHVIMSDELMQAIDSRVGQRGRSRFLEEAAREKLDRLALEDSLRNTSGVLDKEANPMWATRDSTREWVKSARRSESDSDAS